MLLMWVLVATMSANQCDEGLMEYESALFTRTIC